MKSTGLTIILPSYPHETINAPYPRHAASLPPPAPPGRLHAAAAALSACSAAAPGKPPKQAGEPVSREKNGKKNGEKNGRVEKSGENVEMWLEKWWKHVEHGETCGNLWKNGGKMKEIYGNMGKSWETTGGKTSGKLGHLANLWKMNLDLMSNLSFPSMDMAT